MSKQQGEEDELHGWLEPAVEAFVATGAGLLALLGTPEAVLAAGAQGPVRHLITELARRGLAWRARNAATALEAGMTGASMEAEDFLQAFTSSPSRLELLSSVIEAAARATTEAKIRALGQALVRGALGDDDAVNQELLFVRAMADLERPHVQLLNELAEMQPGPFVQTPPAEQVLAQIRPPRAASWSFDPLIATLQRHGAVKEIVVTRFGREILRRLREAGESK